MWSPESPWRLSVLTACILQLTAISACGVSGRHKSDDVQVIRDADERYNTAIVQRDLDTILTFYAADAVSMSPGAPPEHGAPAIRTAWKPLLATPGFALRIVPENIDVAKAGDMRLKLGTTMSR